MRISVGKLLTIRGSHFRSSQEGQHDHLPVAATAATAFAKPSRASRTKLVVRGAGRGGAPAHGQEHQAAPHAPEAARAGRQVQRLHLAAALAGRDGRRRRRRRRRRSRRLRHRRRTATATCCSNSLEIAIRTDPCLRDTDKDGIEDGYEYQSALDLNHYPVNPPLPYPGKRPYPNALDPSDATTDYDGDGLKLSEEFAAWLDFSSDGQCPLRAARLALQPELQRRAAAVAVGCARLPTCSRTGCSTWTATACSATTSATRTATASATGTSSAAASPRSGGRPSTTARTSRKESKYPGINFLDEADLRSGLALTVADMDGDGVLDGDDDQDHDGLSNKFELQPAVELAGRSTATTGPVGLRQPVQPLQAVQFVALPHAPAVRLLRL